MDYEWNLKAKNGQPAIGYQLIYETIADGIPILTTIYCFPKLDQFGNNKIASVSVFWNCDENDITDGFFHWVLDDIGDLIKANENTLFDSQLNKIEIMFTQQFYCKTLPNIDYFTHGDYYIGNN